jgi:hypothetical protein
VDEVKMDDLKWCPRCQDSKLKDEFGMDKAQVDGKVKWCKPCIKTHRLEREKDRTYKLKIRKAPKQLKGFEDQPESIQKIVNVLYENPKLNNREIAVLVGLTPGTIDSYLRSNSFLKSLRYRGSLAISKMIPNAVQSLRESLEAQSEEVKLKASVKILESEKVLGPERVDVTVNDLSNKSYEELVGILGNIKVPNLPPSIDAEVIG